MALDLREMTFQNVLDQILKPNGVKVGGYPDDIFLDISDAEKEVWNCNICFLVLKDARECTNKHLFCHTCIFAWTLTYGENSQRCPVCRNPQPGYKECHQINKQILDKRVKCPEEGCTYKSPLKFFLYHSHGKERFSNNHVDLESLRPQRSSPAGLFILPTLGAVSGAQRVVSMRNQLEQGRTMIHQMVILLHLEMQLRQRSLVSFHQAQNAHDRLQRLDEVLALNEQLNEVGTILSSMLAQPITGAGGTRPPGLGGTPFRVAVAGGVARMPFDGTVYRSTGNDEDSDNDDSDSSDSSGVVSRTRTSFLRNAGASTSRGQNTSTGNTSSQNSSTMVPGVRPSNSTTNRQTDSTPSGAQSTETVNRPQRRHEIREQLNQMQLLDDESTTVTVPSSRNSLNHRRLLNGSNVNVESGTGNSNTSVTAHRSTGVSDGNSGSRNTGPSEVNNNGVPRHSGASTNSSGPRNTGTSGDNGSPRTTGQSVGNSTTRRVLERSRVQNTLNNNEISDSGSSPEVSSQPRVNPQSTSLPPIATNNATTTSVASQEQGNLPRGSDVYSRTIRQLTRDAPTVEQSSNSGQNRPGASGQQGSRSTTTSGDARPGGVVERTSRPNSVYRRESSTNTGSVAQDRISRANTQTNQRTNTQTNQSASGNAAANTNVTESRNEGDISTGQDDDRQEGRNVNIGPSTAESTNSGSATSVVTTSSPPRSYAPQQRFKRGTNESQARPKAATTTRNAAGQQEAARGRNATNQNTRSVRKEKDATNQPTRRVSISQNVDNGNSSTSRSDPSTSNSTTSRNTSTSGSKATGNSTTPTTSQRSNNQPRSDSRPQGASRGVARGPSTAGQLIRARRRSEIYQELMAAKRDED